MSIRDHLCHEEGIPCGYAVNGLSVQVRSFRESSDRLDGERWQPNGDLYAGGNVTKRKPQRMLASHLVITKSPDEKDEEVSNAAADDAEEVQRRLVCPVQIVEHKHERAIALFSQQRKEGVEDPVSVDCIERITQRPVHTHRDVDEWGKGPRRRHRVTRAPKDWGFSGHLRAEGVDKSGLANTGFPAHEDRVPSSLSTLRQQVEQLREHRLALEQCYWRILLR